MKIAALLIVASFSVLTLLTSLSAVASDAYGEPFEEWGFVKDDWQLVCDNTLTCRAAGYSEDEAERRGSILMTLEAGQKVPTTQVLLSYWDWNSSEQTVDQSVLLNKPIELWLNDKYYGKIQLNTDEKGMGELTASQTRQLINHAQNNTKIEFRLGKYQWQISDKGMAAILLKLDEAQGRVGTPLALVSKNNTKRQNLKPAKAMPKIYAAKAYAIEEYRSSTGDDVKQSAEQKFYQRLSERFDRQWQSKMSAWVIPTLNEEERDICEFLTSDQEWFDKDNKVWQFTPIDSKYTLASHPCWTAAYNSGSGYWLINNDKPNKPKLITLSGSDYSNGEVYSAYKGRGIGDCWSSKSWVWNGKTFVKTSEFSTGLCRLIEAGGAWQLPTYVSEVIKN